MTILSHHQSEPLLLSAVNSDVTYEVRYHIDRPGVKLLTALQLSARPWILRPR